MPGNVAVIGCGYWGKNLVRNFHALGVLSLICDVTDEGRSTAAELAPDVPFTDSFQDVLASDVPALVIATPAASHYELTKAALLAGKDVFVEKPLALAYDEGDELVGLAREQGRILMVGHVLEYHPAVVRLHELIRDGVLGKLHYIYSNRLNLGKVRREENILWSFAPHDIAIILRLMGTMPFQVSAVGGAYVQANIPDTTLTNLLFDNGARAHIFVSWLHPFKEQRLVVIGAERMATFDDVSKELLLYDQRVELREGEPVPVKAPGEPVDWVMDEPLRLECEAYLEAVASREDPLTSGESGLQVLRILQAAQRSIVLGGEAVSLPIEVASQPADAAV